MAVLSILQCNDDERGVLRKIAKPIAVDRIPALEPIIQNMFDTMNAIGALGLAAPQIGNSIRLFVLHDGTVCINPEVIAQSGKIKSYGEGCLSVVGRRFNIKRSRNIIVKGLNQAGNEITLKPRNKLDAIAIQHEIDHLNGTLVCDKGKEV